MAQKTFLKITGIIFTLIVIMHILRLVSGWQAIIGGLIIPIWASWLAIIIAGYLAYSAFKLAKL